MAGWRGSAGLGSQNKGKTGVRMLQKQDPRLPALLSLLATDSHMFCLPLPATAAGRLLELVLLLERHWVEHRLTYPLVLLSAMAYRHAPTLVASSGIAACSLQQAAAAIWHAHVSPAQGMPRLSRPLPVPRLSHPPPTPPTYSTHPPACLSPPPHACSTLEFAKSQVEWMNEALVRSLGHARDNPFNTRCVGWRDLGGRRVANGGALLALRRDALATLSFISCLASMPAT